MSLAKFLGRLTGALDAADVPYMVCGTVASAEDTILAKLEWSKDSPSDRQLHDARGIVSVQGDELDQEHPTAWAAELGVTDRLADRFKSGA